MSFLDALFVASLLFAGFVIGWSVMWVRKTRSQFDFDDELASTFGIQMDPSWEPFKRRAFVYKVLAHVGFHARDASMQAQREVLAKWEHLSPPCPNPSPQAPDAGS
jgi:hypothetical protein